MALTKSDIPDLLLPGLKAEFAMAYKTELDHSVAEKIATVVNTSLPSQKYAWLGTVPPMREFVDERRPSGLAANAMSIDDKVFESTIGVGTLNGRQPHSVLLAPVLEQLQELLS